MRRIGPLLLAACILGSGCGPTTATAPTTTASTAPLPTAETIAPTTAVPEASRVLALARQFVFRVRNTVCLGTGTAFATAQGIITNRHVAADSYRVDLATWDGTDFTAQVEGLATDTDLALLTAGGPVGPTAPLGSGDPLLGSAVWVAGYPEGDELSVSEGQVTADVPGTPYGIPGTVLKISNRILPGNSGSPVLDQAEQVVGVVFATETSSGEGLALSLSDLKAFLAVNPEPYAFPCPTD